MHYEIRRGLKTNRQLTTVQRTSGTFAEEPIVLGKVLRRGMRPMLLNEDQFKQHKPKLLRLLLSGSIEIFVINGVVASRVDYKTATGVSSSPVAAITTEVIEPTAETIEEDKVVFSATEDTKEAEVVAEAVVEEEPVAEVDEEQESEVG